MWERELTISAACRPVAVPTVRLIDDGGPEVADDWVDPGAGTVAGLVPPRG